VSGFTWSAASVSGRVAVAMSGVLPIAGLAGWDIALGGDYELFRTLPFPVPNLQRILAVFVDVLLVVD
jgi:hypothetical protein